MNELSFQHPYWLFLMEIIPLMILFYFRNYRKQRAVIQLSSFQNLEGSRPGLKQRLIHLPFFLRLFSVSCVLIALASPVLNQVHKTAGRATIGRVFVLDNTRAMLSRDFKPNRLEVARASLSRFVSEPGSLTGLVVMGQQAMLSSPLTDDGASLRLDVENIQVNINDPEALLAPSLQAACGLLDSASRGHRSILVLDAGRARTEDLSAVIRLARQAGIAVSVITAAGEGTVSAVQRRRGKLVFRDFINEVDETAAKQLAMETGGEYTRVTNASELDEALARFNTLANAKKTIFQQSQEGVFPFSLLAALFLVLELALRQTIFKSLP